MDSIAIGVAASNKGGGGGTSGKDGYSPTVSVTEIDNGHKVNITDKNGTKSFDVLNGEKGDKGDKGDTGSDGKDGSNGKDGYTPVKGTDYWTEDDKSAIVNEVAAQTYLKSTIDSKFKIANDDISANTEAIKQNKTDILLLNKNALMKNQGAENVGKILVVGTDGNLILTDMPEGNGDITGVLDENNNILLSGNLASGRYTLKYEYEDGTVAEVGTIEVGAIPEPTEPTNFADTSSSDWLTDYRLSFNGTELTTKELTGAICTNFVADIQTDDIVRVEGIDFTDTNNRQALVKENGTIIAVDKVTNLPGYSSHITNVTYDSNTLQFTVANTEQLKKLRFSGMLTGTADDVKITITRNGTVL